MKADMLLASIFRAGRALSVVHAAGRFAYLRLTSPSTLNELRRLTGQGFGCMHELSFARLSAHALAISPALLSARRLRRVLRRDDWSVRPQGPCVFVYFHSPWLPIFEHWLEQEAHALAFSHRDQDPKLSPALAQRSTRDVRRLVRHLRKGGDAYIALDLFVRSGGTQTRFLGRELRIRPPAVRIAAAAQVPIVPMWVSYSAFGLDLRFGRPLRVEKIRPDRERVLRELLAVFEQRVQYEPGSWNHLFRFLRDHPRPLARGLAFVEPAATRGQS